MTCTDLVLLNMNRAKPGDFVKKVYEDLLNLCDQNEPLIAEWRTLFRRKENVRSGLHFSVLLWVVPGLLIKAKQDILLYHNLLLLTTSLQTQNGSPRDF